eukprot:GHVH01017395.1.p1 GENE.GHVH01017395.1~~GHVH01017395.1.p1  ORF type:complete len:350 (+),score=32.50 GHVH01017395.1:780-1829(+)
MIFLSSAPLYPWVMNYLGEKSISDKLFTFDYNVWFERKNWFMFALTMAGMAITQVLISLDASSTLLMIYSVCSSVVCCCLQFYALPAPLAKVNLFMFTSTALYVNLQGAMDYWYTADNDCVPGGPDFSFTYYQTLGQSVGVLAGFVGLWIFQTFMSNARFRSVYFVATGLKCLASITDYIILMRWNVAAGIPDRFLYLLGDSIIYPIVSMTSHMPSIILTCKLCPGNVESTAYSLLCAFGNYGGVLSRGIGVYLQDAFNIHLKDKSQIGRVADGEEPVLCTYDNLPLLVLIGHCLLPSISIILAKILIPDARLQDSLEHLHENKNNAEVTEEFMRPEGDISLELVKNEV